MITKRGSYWKQGGFCVALRYGGNHFFVFVFKSSCMPHRPLSLFITPHRLINRERKRETKESRKAFKMKSSKRTLFWTSLSFPYQWGSHWHEWLINYGLLSIQMVSESRLVLSVFRSVHQYSLRAVSISRLAHTVKTRSPNVKRLKTVKPQKKAAPTQFLCTHTHTRLNLKTGPQRSFTRILFIIHR